MDIESPQFDAWEQRFRALAEQVHLAENKLDLAASEQYLCLYGDNGLSEGEEIAELTAMEQAPNTLQKVLVETNYWQDIVLFRN